MRLTRNKKTQYCPKKLLCGIHGFTISICDLCPNLFRIQTGKVPGISLSKE